MGALACLLVASRAAGAEHGPAPAVMTAMLQLYGQYDPAGHCWLAGARDGNPAVAAACISIAQAQDVEPPDGKRTYILLVGSREADGLTVAFVEFGGTHGLRVVAHSPVWQLGSPPGQAHITLQRLGASQWGWIAEVGANGANNRDLDYVVWLPRGGRIVPVARFPHARDDITVSYQIDAADAQADYYPIMLQAHGRKNRRPVSAGAVARFDLPRYRYDITPELP